MPELREFHQTSIYPLKDAMNWELYKDSLNYYLSDAAETDIISRFPKETEGLMSVTSEIEVIGQSMSWEQLAFLVTVHFSNEEN